MTALNLTHLATHANATIFQYAVQAKIYASRPSLAYVTARGDCGAGGNCSAAAVGRTSAGASIAALQLLDTPPYFAVGDSWTTEKFALEGQDLCCNEADPQWIVVASLLHGHLLSFNASCLRCGPRHVLKLSTNSALHVRSYRSRGSHWALFSTGFASQQQPRRNIAGAVLAVSVDASTGRLSEVASVTDRDGVPSSAEGVLVEGDYAYVGGCSDTKLVQIELTGLSQGLLHGGTRAAAAAAPALRVTRTLVDPTYVQLVGAPLRQHTIALALWGREGGLATFRLRPAPGASPVIEEIGRLTAPQLARANRVHVHDGFAWLPLEQPAGALAAVDVSDPARPALALGPHVLPTRPFASSAGPLGGQWGDGDRDGRELAGVVARRERELQHARGPSASTSYCLALQGDRLYAFAAQSAQLFVCRVSPAMAARDGDQVGAIREEVK